MSGTWFDANRIQSKKVVLNEAAAWEIFGSSNIVGLEVGIGGSLYQVSGIIRTETNLFSEQAGEEQCQIYLPYEVLQAYEKKKGITCYEIILPNPVQGFALDAVKKQGIAPEKKMELIQNTGRFSWQTRWNEFPNVLTRMMKTKEVCYPFWENKVRAWEGIRDLLFVCQIVWGVIGLKYFIAYLFLVRYNKVRAE